MGIIRIISCMAVFWQIIATDVGNAQTTQYSFLDEDHNIIYQKDETTLAWFYHNLDSLILRGDRQLNILHMGDSHIQAGFFPESARRHLQNMFLLDNGGRGFVFPYRIGNTNNPLNYRVSYGGNWEVCKSIQRNHTCALGVSGMSVTTFDTTGYITINPNNIEEEEYLISHVKIFYDVNDKSFIPHIKNADCIEQINHDLYTEFILKEEVKEITVVFEQTDPGQNHFTLYGLTLESNDPGIVYSSVGVNGADIPAYLNSSLLSAQLEVLSPDMVIISLGANDAYLSGFDPAAFKSNYSRLIDKVRQALPKATIILTTPGDGYRKKRYYNYNYVKAREVILKLAQEKNVGVWDFFTVMGGPNSIYQWYKNGLATNDKLHLTREGYYLQGKLFYDAIMKSYYQYLDNRNK